ncbi:unnamed protein product [Rotaria sordida]|uniref:Uncharacterized protein n=1 Tax=Rotaria sordida TaxID=392033 RepID=A0A818SUW5_9BILA|nr:unnamed protein product [Rotaria sordida]
MLRSHLQKCYSLPLPDVISAAGEDYVVPRGWAGFGLQVDTTLVDYHNLWEEWIVTYHGTSTIAAESILAHRQFLLPGDTLLNGKPLSIRPGHIPGKAHLYTSPSILYASLNVYSVRYNFTDSSGKKYEAKIVFQCRQKPKTFCVQAETVGRGKDPICPFISNDKIEYYTVNRSSVVPYRLLVSLKEL